jgi:hypothetical protein
MITTYPQKDKLTRSTHYSASLVQNSKCCAMNQQYQHKKKNAVQGNMLKLQLKASYSRDTGHEHPVQRMAGCSQHEILDHNDGLTQITS